MIHAIRRLFVSFTALTLLTGVAYPLLVTVIANFAWPGAARGSLVTRDGRAVGSRLLGQEFTAPGHFWGRLSATTPQPYNGGSSTGSNLAATNPAAVDAAKARIAALRAADPSAPPSVPADLVTASGSGLDPDISPAAADYQVPRVAAARGVPVAEVRRLVAAHTTARWLGIFGEPRVNVLELNLALDSLH